MFLEPEAADLASRVVFDSSTARWWSRLELRQAVEGFASRICEARGGLTFLLCRNTAPVLASYLAAVEAGCAVHLLDARTPPATLAALLDRYRPELVLAPDDGLLVAGHRQDGPYLGLTLWWREGERLAPVHPELAVLLGTSGSTGSPKLVRLSRRSVEANADSIVRSLGIDSRECAMASLPISYSYGLSVVNSHLRAGASMVLTDETVISPRFWNLLREQCCSSLPGVPYTYDLLVRIGFDKLPAPSLRTLTQAGGRLATDRAAHFHAEMVRRGGRFFVMYGQTEATARITCLPSCRLVEKLGSVGTAIPGGSLRVDFPPGSSRDSVAAGEVVYSGPNVMMGYGESREDLARGDELGGHLRTGDLGRLDEDGFLYLIGRSKRIGKVLGMRVNLDDVEVLLRPHGPAAVIAADEGLDIYCEYGDAATFANLAGLLARDLRATPDSFRFHRLAFLPRTSGGKVDYQVLRRE